MPDGTRRGLVEDHRRREPREEFWERRERCSICVDIDTLHGAKVRSEEGKDVLLDFSREQDPVGTMGGCRESMMI